MLNCANVKPCIVIRIVRVTGLPTAYKASTNAVSIESESSDWSWPTETLLSTSRPRTECDQIVVLIVVQWEWDRDGKFEMGMERYPQSQKMTV